MNIIKVAVVNPTRIFDPWETYLTIGTIGLCPDGMWLDHTSLTLAEIIRQKGFNVKYFDGENRLMDPFDLAEEIKCFVPKYVIIATETVDYERAPQINYSYVNRLVEMIKTFNSGVKVLVYGTHPMVDMISLSKQIDYVVMGDPEEVIPNLIEDQCGLKRGTWDTVGNASFRTENLDALPFPAVDLVENVDAKCSEYASGLKGKFIQLALSRGCNYSCGFCFRSTGTEIRRMSVPRAVELLTFLKSKGFESFFFIDDCWGGGLKGVEWAKELCKRMIPLDIKWSCQTRADIVVDKELAQLMKLSGCETVGFGLETYNEDLLIKNGKALRLDDIDKAYEALTGADLKVIMFWVLGLVGETEATIQRTINYILKKKPYGAGCLLAVPYPMSKMSNCKEGFVYEAYLKAGMVGNDVFKDLYDARKRWAEIDRQVSGEFNLLSQVKKYRPNVYERYEQALVMLRKMGRIA